MTGMTLFHASVPLNVQQWPARAQRGSNEAPWLELKRHSERNMRSCSLRRKGRLADAPGLPMSRAYGWLAREHSDGVDDMSLDERLLQCDRRRHRSEMDLGDFVGHTPAKRFCGESLRAVSGWGLSFNDPTLTNGRRRCPGPYA